MLGGDIIASPAVVYVAKKVAVDLSTDKRTWVVIGSVVAGVLIVILIPLLIIFSGQSAINAQTLVIELCFNNEEIPIELGENNILFIENMRFDYGEIDTVLSEVETENADDLFIKSSYYILNIDDDLVFTEEFFISYVEAFFYEDGVYIDDKELIYDNLDLVVGYDISVEQKKDIDIVYNFIKYGTIPNGLSDFSGISPEALEDETFRQLMTEATRYIGYPYVWGGSEPSTSFDCSGYICWVYTQSGVHNLPRTTAQQIYNQCVPIQRSEAKPGDLVFFTKTYKTSDPVTHVGIFVGDGKMLHCGDPIGYADIDSSYWSSHFYNFGRLN